MNRWLVLVAACAPGDRPRWEAAGNPSHDGGTLHVATAERVSRLDPTAATDEVSTYVVHALFDTLVDYAPATSDGAIQFVPRLAASYEISPDGRTYTFRLRPNIAFGDRALVAADLAYSLDRARADAGSLGHQYVDHIATIDAHGLDLAIHLEQPDPAFLAVLAMPFTTPQRPDHRSTDVAPFGIGPYQLDGWIPGQSILLRRNPTYYDPGRVHLDAIELRENVPPELAALLFDRGELDLLDHLASQDQQWFTTRPAWQPFVKTAPQLTTFGWRMDTRVPPFDDVRVRRAFNLADNKAHVIRLLAGTATPAHGMLPPRVLGRDDSIPPYPYDPQTAHALLVEAHFDFTREVRLVTYTGDESERIAASFQADLAAVGVRARTELRSFAELQDEISKPGAPAISLGTWGGDSPDPTAFLDAQFHSRLIPAGTNNTGYANPELDALLDAARAERDPGRRAAMYRRADHILHDDAPWVWEYHRTTTEVVQPYVKGYAIHPIWVRDFTPVWLDVGADGERVPR